MSINTHDFNWDKVDKFFDKEKTQEALIYANQRITKAIDEVHHDLSNSLAEYFADEFVLSIEDEITSKVKKVVESLLLGDEKTLEEFNLAPAEWGVKCDYKGLRRKIVEENVDIIKDTHILSLEEELKNARETINYMMECRNDR